VDGALDPESAVDDDDDEDEDEADDEADDGAGTLGPLVRRESVR
jgi:hypothetical protein